MAQRKRKRKKVAARRFVFPTGKTYSPGPGLLRSIQTAVFLGTVFAFLYWVVDPTLLCHGARYSKDAWLFGPGIEATWEMFATPGGAALVVGAYVARLCCEPFMGGFVITVMAGFLTILSSDALNLVGANRILRFVLPTILALQYGLYFFFQDGGFSVLLGVASFCLCARISQRRPVVSAVSIVLLSALVYLLAAKAFAGLLCLWFVLHGVRFRQWRSGLVALAIAVAIPVLLGTTLFNRPPGTAFLDALPWYDATAVPGGARLTAMHLFLPVAALLTIFGERFRKREHRPKPGSQSMFQTESRMRQPAAEMLLVLIGFGTLAWHSLDQTEQRLLRIDRSASSESWQEVLEDARLLSTNDYTLGVCHDVNRALNHLGRLSEEMFSYPQHHRAALIISPIMVENGAPVSRSYNKLMDVFYDLGYMNDAEHAAHEALELSDYNPFVYRRLALINLAKEQTEAGGLILRALRKDPAFRVWADQYLAALKHGPALEDDPHIVGAKARRILRDRTALDVNVADVLVGAIKQNPQNRFAFEYLMAHYLVIGHPEMLTQNMSFLDDFGYSKETLPKHFEEAVLLVQHGSPDTIPLLGRRLTEERVARFNTFMERLASYPSRHAAKVDLAEAYGDTYYYYYHFVFQGGAP